MVLMVTHQVRDFDAWKPVFEAEEAARWRFGARRHRLYRNPEDGNDLLIAIDMPSADAARRLLLDAKARRVFEAGGVLSEPAIRLHDEVEAITYACIWPDYRWHVNADGW